jgi:hypothetical protein
MGERRAGNLHGAERSWIESGSDELERASRDAAAARLFARMAAVHERNANTRAGEPLRGPRSGGPGTDDRHVIAGQFSTLEIERMHQS